VWDSGEDAVDVDGFCGHSLMFWDWIEREWYEGRVSFEVSETCCFWWGSCLVGQVWPLFDPSCSLSGSLAIAADPIFFNSTKAKKMCNHSESTPTRRLYINKDTW